MSLYDAAFDYASQAVEEDNSGNGISAYYLYMEAAELFLQQAQTETNDKSKELIRIKTTEFLTRAEELRPIVDAANSGSSYQPSTASDIGIPSSPPPSYAASTSGKSDEKSSNHKDDSNAAHLALLYDRAFDLVKQAKASEKEKSNDTKTTFKLYLSAAETFHRCIQLETDPKKIELVKSEVRSFTKKAEEFRPNPLLLDLPSVPSSTPTSAPAPSKKSSSSRSKRKSSNSTKSTSTTSTGKNSMGITSSGLTGHTRSNSTTSTGGSGRSLTEAERKVLFDSSIISGRRFVPFFESDTRLEDWGDPNKARYTDPDGALMLSDKQKSKFEGWKRPHQIFENSSPKIISLISAYTITQTIVADCSFVASLTVAANYERRHSRHLVSRCIYPQNSEGKPVFNKNGKYMVKLTLNGCARKIIIDDFIPCGRNNSILCSYSNNPGELWVTLLEKAYLKVMGGYAFPGSNSGIDIYALYGWIPEDINLPFYDKNFAPDKYWPLFLKAFSQGMGLFTVSTADISPKQEEEIGLYDHHAYAILDIRQVGALRFFQLKNPWASKRWKGRFSAQDTASWTPALQKALNYDIMAHHQTDNGMFWMTYEDLCKYFGVIHISWNPKQFRYSTAWHGRLARNLIPPTIEHILHAGKFPQYALRVGTPAANTSASKSKTVLIWVLLSKHFTVPKYEDDDYITIHVFANTGGERVYFLDKPLHHGTYRNNPHYLAKIEVPPSSTHTLVVSTFARNSDLRFTVKVWASAAPIDLSPVPNYVKSKRSIVGNWSSTTAGGSLNGPTFYRNPQYRVRLTQPMYFLAKLECPNPKYSLNLEIVKAKTSESAPINEQRISVLTKDITFASTGTYRRGLAVYINKTMPAGDYIIIPSTFEANEEGAFNLDLYSSFPSAKTMVVSKLSSDDELFPYTLVQSGRWHGPSAGGSGPNYNQNPRFSLSGLSKPCRVTLRLSTPNAKPLPCINIAVYGGSPSKLSRKEALAETGTYTNPPSGIILSNVRLPASPSGFTIVPSAHTESDIADFQLEVLSEFPLTIK